MKKLELYVSAVLAGGMIGVGGMVYLSLGRTPLGAFLFAVGLFAVCVWGMALFTGRIGDLIGQRPAFLIDLAVIWLGNLTGCLLAGLAMRIARPALAEACVPVAAGKLAQTPGQTLLLGLFCGLLMYIAVNHYRRWQGDLGRFVGIFICVPVFILSGFEHVVADMFYFALGGTWEQLGQIALFLAICTVGNALGAFLLPLWQKMKK